MQNPIKHHYVPQIYLKRFAINQTGDLYKYNINSKYVKKPKRVNKAAICYEKHMYTLQNEEYINEKGINDNYFVEKSAFQYENKELTFLFDKIEHRDKLSGSEYIRFLKIILNIKKRNPSLREKYLNSENDRKYIRSRSKTLSQELLSVGLKSEEIKVILAKAQEDVLSKIGNNSYRMDMYRYSISEKEDSTIKVNNKILQNLESWSTTIFQTIPTNPFITSDNPGFTIKDDKYIFNTDLNYVDSFVFPISPISLLYLSKEDSTDKKLLFRKINYKKASNEIVLYFNSGTYMSSRKMIISGNENQLTITKDYNK